MTDIQIIRKIKNGVMGNNLDYLTKSLWRMTNGDKNQSYDIIRGVATHYGLVQTDIEDYHIDMALAELNGGVEIEWES